MKTFKLGFILFTLLCGIKNASAVTYFTQCSACEPSSVARLWAVENISLSENGVSKTVTVLDMTNYVATTFSVELIQYMDPFQMVPVSYEVPTDSSYAQFLDDIRGADQKLRLALKADTVPVDVIDDPWEDFIDCGSACANLLADWINATYFGKIEAYSLTISNLGGLIGLDLTGLPDIYTFPLSNGGHIEAKLELAAYPISLLVEITGVYDEMGNKVPADSDDLAGTKMRIDDIERAQQIFDLLGALNYTFSVKKGNVTIRDCDSETNECGND